MKAARLAARSGGGRGGKWIGLGTGKQFDAEAYSPETIIVPGPWVVRAEGSDYNSRDNAHRGGYEARGTGNLTMAMLNKHADKVAAHADKQDASRFFELFNIRHSIDRGGQYIVDMEFGS